jgi:hypothetical protein
LSKGEVREYTFAFFPTPYLLLEEDNFEFSEVQNIAGEHLEHPAVDVAL